MHQGKIGLILQARMGSTRLPGKSIMPLAGKPLIERILERVKRCEKPDIIILATTQLPSDDIIAEIALKNDVELFRGAENDLVDRYYKAAKKFGLDIVVRLPADNPVVEPAEIDRIIEHFINSDDDFSANTHNILFNEYPDGLGAEVFSTDKLAEINELTTDPRNREHPHTFFYEHPEKYKIGTVKCPKEFRRPDLVLDVNTYEEYQFISAIYDALYPNNPNFHITEIINWYDNKYKKGNSL